MKVRYLAIILSLLGLAGIGSAMPAMAAARNSISVSFFGGADGPVANGSAHWTRAASNDGDPFSVLIDVPQGVGAPDFYSSYGGIEFHHVAGTPPPATPPSFDFMSTVSGASGGSPRLVINFSDGGNIDLRPLTWTANTWTTESGSSTDWDNGGGSCGSLYEQTYATVIACHAGATVTSAYIVSDSGWLYPSGYQNYIDNITYNGTTISQPSDNANS
ncbi:MAG TPA: hypothetical protein VNF47_13245 [Streptosporangiaceae bacterium]|nr:hypothetical protein [Streptosporangiaceae bacterium]